MSLQRAGDRPSRIQIVFAGAGVHAVNSLRCREEILFHGRSDFDISGEGAEEIFAPHKLPM